MRFLVLLLFWFYFILNGVESNLTDLTDEVIGKLDNVLKFVFYRSEEFSFDGLFGIVLAEANLVKLSGQNLEQNTIIEYFIDLCQKIRTKIWPHLPNYPSYMITFKHDLLDAQKWAKYVITNDFFSNSLFNLGVYTNWTREKILSNTRAVFNGIYTDVCFKEILKHSSFSSSRGEDYNCFISETCREMMLNRMRIDTGYLLTHRLLYLQIAKLNGCKIPYQGINYIKNYCSLIYKEACTNEKLNFPYVDIFLEQVVLCGNEGFAEFITGKSNNWIEMIVSFQTQHGCYKSRSDIISNLQKRTSATIDFGCSDHSTGLGAAALALNLRYFMQHR